MADEVIAGRYRLEEPLGRGSMSAVWAAQDLELGRRVAVKVLAPSADRQRFEREARAAASLSHPNIVSLYDYGRSDARPFMVLECLTGGSLEELLRERAPLDETETRRIARDVAAGLAHAHERGLVHRDLKPANILFDAEGRAKIADFGIVRMSGTGTLTEAGTVLGTASYLSPEQAAGLPAGPASDVYSFGVILFRMLTGRLPFESANAMELVRMHRDDPPPAVRDVRQEAPPALAALAEAALGKEPASRPADGDALLALLADDGTQATRVLPPAARPPGRRRLLAVLIAAASLLLAGGALALALTTGHKGAATTTAPLLSLPSVPTATSEQTTPVTPTVAGTTTEAETTAGTTPETAPATTARTTTATTTQARETTAPATTTVAPTTTAAGTTTVATTTTAAPTTTAATTAPATSTSTSTGP